MNRFHIKCLVLGSLLGGLSSPAYTDGYGIFDSRGLALGGTGVAIGNADSGHFYNPALTAFHQGHEDRTRDGSHSLHVILAAVSDGAQTAADAITDDLEARLSNAIDDLNDVPTPATARAGIQAAQDLEKAMRHLDGKNINADGYLGYSISVPGDMEGGAFFVGSRLIGRGIANIESADFQLMQDYVEALEFIESGGTRGQEHPELRDAQGRFTDPSKNIQSSARGTGLLVSELGISAAKQYAIWGHSVAFGAAPKAVYLRIFDESWQVVDGEFTSLGENRTEVYFNLDLGAAVTLAEHWRVALAIKDVRSKTVWTETGDRIQLQPRPRLGLAYVSDALDVGLDVDLDQTPDPQDLTSRQDISLGIEYRLSTLISVGV